MTSSAERQVTLVVALAMTAWVVAVERMSGVDMGPGTNLGGFGWFLGVWVTMMIAMMLPSALPMVLLYARVAAQRRCGSAWVFVAGYLMTWTAFGLAAYALYRSIRGLDPAFLAWDAGGPYVAGAAVAAAGIYELTPLKRVCLRHCRSPLHFVLGGWRDGNVGALRMGTEHGAYCVGCCWGLMLILFALGVMSLFWMALVATLIFAQKVLPRGDRLAPIFALAFVAFGLWVGLAPSTVPGLEQPGTGTGTDQMQMR